MKKFILASVALIALFASCKKEDIRTVYKAEPAKATIAVEVFDAYQGKSVTSDAKIEGSVGTVTGNKIVIVGDKAHFYAIPAQDVVITASYEDKVRNETRKNSVTIKIDGVLEDGEAFYSALVIVGSAVDPTKPISYDIVTSKTKPDPDKVIKTGYLEKATHSHNGQKWCINNTEFVLFGTTTYPKYDGYSKSDSSLEMIEGAYNDDEKKVAKGLLDTLLDELPEKKSEIVTAEYKVSAFSYYNFKVEYKQSYFLYDVVRVYTLADGKTTSNVSIAKIKLAKWDTKGQKIEMASPDHASHYVEGHGVDDPHYSHYDHGHGHGGSNAGGGIVVAD